MAHRNPALVIAEAIVHMRRRLAPPGSYRESIARAVYVPVFDQLMRRQMRTRKQQAAPTATCERFRGLAERSLLLPQQPNIVILKLDNIGDFILALRAMEHLRDSFADAKLTLVCGSWNQEWAERSGLFNKVVGFDFLKRGHSPTPTESEQFKKLEIGHQDLAIDLRHDPDTRSLLTLVRASFRAGFCAPPDMGGDSLDIALPDVEAVSVEAGNGKPLHAELRLLLLAHAITDVFGSKQRHPGLRLLSGAATQVGTSPYAILAPGAGSPIRLWPLDRLITVGRALVEQYGLEIVVIGLGADDDAGKALAKELPEGSVRNLTGLVPLRDLPDLVKGARLYVGYDTGTTHLAAVLGVPTVSILSGVPNAEVWHTVGEHVTVVAGRIACSPCYFVQARQCPYGVACLKVISVEHVLDACNDQLTGVTPKP
jgi:ADP-heptose:LPS heptosyltransferase